MIPAFGAMCLGVFMGWLIRYFIFRYKEFTPQIFATTIAVVMGGAVVGFLNSVDDNTVWFYPIGLLIGSVIYSVFGYMTRNKQDPNSGQGTVFYTSIDVDDENK